MIIILMIFFLIQLELRGGIHERLQQTILSQRRALCLQFHVRSILLMHELSPQLAMRSSPFSAANSVRTAEKPCLVSERNCQNCNWDELPHKNARSEAHRGFSWQGWSSKCNPSELSSRETARKVWRWCLSVPSFAPHDPFLFLSTKPACFVDETNTVNQVILWTYQTRNLSKSFTWGV